MKPSPTGRSGPDARVLHPFRPLLAGSVLLPGPAPADLVALLRATARTVATLDEPTQGPSYDTVLLLDPPASTWEGPVEPGADRLAHVLARAAGLLRPGGHLIVVIENALSLRHFAGHPETDAAPDMFSLEDRARPDGLVLPTRRGLRDRLAGLGLTEQEWWFPFPDHRLALSLVSERGLALGGAFDPGVLAAGSAPFDPGGPGADRFSLQRAWAGVARAGLVGDLAPAFAVAASAAALPPDQRLALHFGHRRRPAFDKVVGFVHAGDAIRVTRTPLHPDLPRAVDGVTNRFPDEPFVPGAPWQAGLQALLARDGWTTAGIVAWASVWRDAVRALHAGSADLTLGTPLPGGAIDAIPRNLVHRDGVPVFIDAEWEIDALDFGHLLVRGLVNALTDVEACGTPGPGITPTLLPLVLAVAEGLGTALDAAALDAALARESRFQSTVSGVETRRNRAWLAATRLPLRTAPPDPFAARDRAIAHLHGAVAAVRAEGDRRVAAVTDELEESRLRTDRVIRYAAELDRERGRLAFALAEAQERDRPLEDDLRRRRFPLATDQWILTSARLAFTWTRRAFPRSLAGDRFHASRGRRGSPLLEGEGQGEVRGLSGKVTHLTPTLSFQEREPVALHANMDKPSEGQSCRYVNPAALAGRGTRAFTGAVRALLASVFDRRAHGPGGAER